MFTFDERKFAHEPGSFAAVGIGAHTISTGHVYGASGKNDSIQCLVLVVIYSGSDSSFIDE